MQYNTAILYDIENLIGGYRKTEYLQDFSLREVHRQIVGHSDVERYVRGIAVQRAYANWSDSRLGVMRSHLVELGIEPVQMFGFGKGPDKNASDIHLAVDAVDLALTNANIETLVIVSGDGGYSCLAQKLHERGKAVIGCAYRKTTNRVFAAVCDEFIWLDAVGSSEVENGEANEAVASPVPNAKRVGSHEDIRTRYQNAYRQLENVTRKSAFNRATETLAWLTKHSPSKEMLSRQGVNISVCAELLSHRIRGFDCRRYGVPRLVDFLRMAIPADRDIHLVLRPPSDYRFVSHPDVLEDYSLVEPSTGELDVHTTANYRELLTRTPNRFHLDSPATMQAVAEYLVEHRGEITEKSLTEIAERVQTDCGIGLKEVRGILTTFLSSHCFRADDPEAELADRKLTFLPDSTSDTLDRVTTATRSTLVEYLGEVEEDPFLRLFVE